MSDNVVGRVSVRVIPNTRGFRRDANAQLRRLQKELVELKAKVVVDLDKSLTREAKKVSKRKPIEVPVEAPKLDLGQFQKDAARELKKISDKLTQQIELTPDKGQYRQDIERVVRDAEDRIKQKITLDAELASSASRDIRNDLTALRARVSRVDPIRIRVQADRATAERQLLALMSSIPDMAARGDSKIQLQVDQGAAKTHLRSLIAELKAEAALANIEIDVDIDTPVLKRSALAIGNISESVASLATSFGGSSGIVLGLAVVAAVAPALSLVSGLLTTLPGAFAALLTPIAAITLGMDGLKKAAEKLKPKFEELKKAMSSAFEKAFTPLADQLNNSGVFTVLQERLPLIANGLATMARGFVDSITSAAGLNKIDGIIGNIAASLHEARPGVKAFTDGLLGLAEGFAAKFPEMGKAFSKLGDDFSAWVKEITTIDSLGSTPLDRVLETLRGVLGELGGLGKDLLKAGFEWASDPEFGKKMKDFVADVRYLVDTALPAFKQAFIDIGTVVSDVTGNVKTLKSLLEAMGKVPGLGDVFGFGEGAQNGVKPDANFGEKFLAGMKDQFSLGNIVKYLNPMNLITPIVDSFSQLVPLVMPKIAMLFTSIITKFAELPSYLSAIFATIPAQFAGITSGIQTALSGIPSYVANVVSTVAAWFGQLPGIVAGAIGQLAGTVAAGFGQVVATIAAGMAEAVAAVATGVANIIAEAGSIGSKVAAAVGNLGGVLVAAGQSLMDGLLSGITAGLGKVLAFASGIAAKIAAVKGPLPKDRKTLTPAGEALMEGLGTGLESGLAPVIAQVKQIAGAIFDALFDSMRNRELDVSGLTSGVGSLNSGMKDLSATSGRFRANLSSAIPQAGDVSGLLREITAEKDLLDLRVKELGVLKDRAPDKMAKAGLQAQLDQINARRREISLQQEQIDYQKKYGQEVQSTAANYDQQMSDLSRVPYDFAVASGQQLMSDLGIGGGALSGLAMKGLEYGSQFIFNVSNVDEALAVKTNEQNKQARAAAR